MVAKEINNVNDNSMTELTFQQEIDEAEQIYKNSFTRLGEIKSIKHGEEEQSSFVDQYGKPNEDVLTLDEKVEKFGWSRELENDEIYIKAKNGDPKALFVLKKREFRSLFSIINYSGKTFVHSRNSKGELEFQDFKAFKEYYLSEWFEWDIEDAKGNMKPKKFFVAEEFLKDKYIKKYEGIDFAPGTTSSKFLNLWSGWSVTPQQGNVDLFLKLVRSLTNYDDSATEYLLNYTAHIFQIPEKKPETAIVMRSKSHGVGKGSLMKLLGKLTSNYGHLTSSQSLGGTFSGHLMDKIIVFLDENTWAPGDKAIEGRIKGLITEPVVGIRMMRKDEIQVKSFLRIFIASNEDFPVAIAGEDRRFFVVDCSDKYKGKTNPGEFFYNFNHWLENNGDKAVMHYLLNRDISNFNPRIFPKTKARLDIQLLSLPTASKFIYELLNGTAPLDEETMTVDGLRRRFKRNSLYADMVEWCKISRAYPPSTDEFGKTINRFLDFTKDNANWKTSWSKKVNGRNEYYYQLSSLAEFQKRFAKNALDCNPEDIFFNYIQQNEELKEATKYELEKTVKRFPKIKAE